MRSSSSLLGRIFMGIALRLEILMKIFKKIFNENEVWGLKAEVWGVSSYENLSPCTPCAPWIILVAYGKKSLEEILFKMLLTQEINHRIVFVKPWAE